MNRLMKGFITACLAVCMIVCLGLAVACTDENPDVPATPTSCTVTVKLEGGSPAVGVTVQVCAIDGEVQGCKFPAKTDADGKVVVDVKSYLDGGTTHFEVHLSNLPEGYAYVDASGNEYEAEKGVVIDTAKGYTADITLKVKTEKKTDLGVTVALDDGSPAVGVGVRACALNGSLKGTDTPVDTNVSGEATLNVSKYLDGGTTLFEIYLSNIPDGYQYVDEEGVPYAEEEGVNINVSNGYTVEIVLVKEKPLSLNVSLANAAATQKITPSIKASGLYELRSVNSFKVSNDGFKLDEGYYGVLIYLEVGDSLTFGAVKELEYSVSVVASTVDGKDTPVSTLTAGAVVVKLGANESLNVTNPKNGLGGTTNTPVIVGGSNFTATLNSNNYSTDFPVAAGKDFSVKATDASKYVVLTFSNPESSVSVGVGESKAFDVDLITTANGNDESLQWLSSEYHIVFTTTEAGFYKISVSSNYDADELFISQVGSDYHFPDNSLQGNGKTAYAVCKLKAGETYRAYVSTSSAYADKNEGDRISYTATVEKVDPVYQNLTGNLGAKQNIDKNFAYSYTVEEAGDYLVTVSDVGTGWYLNGELITAKSGTVTVGAGDKITIDPSANGTVTIKRA